MHEAFHEDLVPIRVQTLSTIGHVSLLSVGSVSTPHRIRRRSTTNKTPQVRNVSSRERFVVLVVPPGRGLAVAGTRLEAAVQVPDEAVAGGTERLVVEIARRSSLVVERATPEA